jgi:hypothetical protein
MNSLTGGVPFREYGRNSSSLRVGRPGNTNGRFRRSGRVVIVTDNGEKRGAPLSKKVARVTGLEPATSGVTGRHSNQLSYTRVSRPKQLCAPARGVV